MSERPAQANDDHVYKSGRGLAARAVRCSTRHLGWDYPSGWMCCHCGRIPCSSPVGQPPGPQCWNCGATLAPDPEGPQEPTKEERLTIQVVHLKCCILSARQAQRLVATYGPEDERAKRWLSTWRLSDPADCPALTETWEAYGGCRGAGHGRA